MNPMELPSTYEIRLYRFCATLGTVYRKLTAVGNTLLHNSGRIFFTHIAEHVPLASIETNNRQRTQQCKQKERNPDHLIW